MRTNRRFIIVMLLASVTTVTLAPPILPVLALRDRKALLPTADAMMRSYSPDTNEGRAVEFWVMSNGEEILSFMMFNLAELPAGSTIEEATLRLYEPTEGTINLSTVNVHNCPNNDWTEDGITYNNRPAFQPEPIDSVNITSGQKWYEWNLTSTATSAFSAADKRLSLALEGNTHGFIVGFDSRQSPAVTRRPELSVLYSYTPSSAIDPVLIGLVVVAIVAASAIGLIAYTRRKRRKQSV